MHAHVTIRADLTWNVLEVSIHCQTEDEHGQTQTAQGVRAQVLLEEVPALGEEEQEVMHALGRELLSLAATMRGSRHQTEV